MILDYFKLDGKVAIVTGARKGLGRRLAQEVTKFFSSNEIRKCGIKP